jgi:hypothetical protein
MWSPADCNRLLFEVDRFQGERKHKWQTIQLSFPEHSVHSCKQKYFSLKRSDSNWTSEELNEVARVAFTATPALENREGEYLHEVLHGSKTIRQCKGKIKELRAKKKRNKKWTSDEIFALQSKQTHLLQRTSSGVRNMRQRIKQKGIQELYNADVVSSYSVLSRILDNAQCTALQALYHENASMTDMQAKLGVSQDVIQHYLYKLAHGLKMPPYEMMVDLYGYFMQFKTSWTHIASLLNEEYDDYPVSRRWCAKEVKYLGLL